MTDITCDLLVCLVLLSGHFNFGPEDITILIIINTVWMRVWLRSRGISGNFWKPAFSTIKRTITRKMKLWIPHENEQQRYILKVPNRTLHFIPSKSKFS